MPSNIERLDQNFPWDRSPLQKELRRLMGVLEPRLKTLENQVVDWEAAVDKITSVGINRVNETLGVLLGRLQLAVDVGFMVIQAAEQPQTLVEDAILGFEATSEGSELFQPTKYVLIVDDDDHTNWGMLEIQSWIKNTGELSTKVVYAAKEQSGSNWTISCNAAVWQAMRDLLDAAVAAKDSAEALVSQFSDDLATLQVLISGLEEFGVVSVQFAGGDVQNGIVSINPVIADISGLQTAIDAKAATTYVNTQLAGKQDASAKLDAIVNLTWTADRITYSVGVNGLDTTPLTAFARTLLDDADQATAKTTLGVPAAATDSEIRSATGSGYVAASAIESASALVTLTDATTIALDWDTGINFQVTLTANRALGNPTNGQPGTTRTVLLKGDSTTDRTISFGNEYLGSVPNITDIDSGRWYLLTIFCITATHFAVTSKKVYGT